MVSLRAGPSVSQASLDKPTRNRPVGNASEVITSEFSYQEPHQTGSDKKKTTEGYGNLLFLKRTPFHSALLSRKVDPTPFFSDEDCKICTESSMENHFTTKCPYLLSVLDSFSKRSSGYRPGHLDGYHGFYRCRFRGGRDKLNKYSQSGHVKTQYQYKSTNNAKDITFYPN